MTKLSEHLKSVAIAHCSQEMVASAFEGRLRRYGAVRRTSLTDWRDMKRYLLPLKSFTTRFVCVEINGWTQLISNMRNASGSVDVLFVSTALRCRAVSADFRDDGRFFELIDSGKEIRSIACYEDDGPWVFVERGAPQPWEHLENYLKRRRKDRLTPELVQLYLKQAGSPDFPKDWGKERRLTAVGLERSLKDLVVEVKEFSTEDDVP